MDFNPLVSGTFGEMSSNVKEVVNMAVEYGVVTGSLPQLNDPTMISIGTKVMVMLLLQYSQQ